MPHTIGVVGGMGPWATLDFFEKVLRLTPAQASEVAAESERRAKALLPEFLLL